MRHQNSRLQLFGSSALQQGRTELLRTSRNYGDFFSPLLLHNCARQYYFEKYYHITLNVIFSVMWESTGMPFTEEEKEFNNRGTLFHAPISIQTLFKPISLQLIEVLIAILHHFICPLNYTTAKCAKMYLLRSKLICIQICFWSVNKVELLRFETEFISISHAKNV